MSPDGTLMKCITMGSTANHAKGNGESPGEGSVTDRRTLMYNAGNIIKI